MLGNDENIINFYQKKGIHIYSENDDRNNFDGQYGLLTYNKTSGRKNKPLNEWIIAVGLHSPIISGKEWVATQELLQKNADKCYRAIGEPKKQTIVSGLLKCRICGSYMRARNMDKKRSDGGVNYRYCCNLKEKSKGKKCNGLNVKGEELDNKILDIIKQISVPNIEVYKELKKISTYKAEATNNTELECLQDTYNKKQEEIERLIEKLKYIDIDLISIINENLRKLRQEKEELEMKINNKKAENYDINTEMSASYDVIKIIENSFDIFNTFDLKTKRNIAGLFIESIYGNGEEVELNLLNIKIDESQKSIIYLL